MALKDDLSSTRKHTSDAHLVFVQLFNKDLSNIYPELGPFITAYIWEEEKSTSSFLVAALQKNNAESKGLESGEDHILVGCHMASLMRWVLRKDQVTWISG